MIYSPNQLYPKFNWIVYKSLYPDLEHLNRLDAELHWFKYGRYEGRRYEPEVKKNIIIKGHMKLDMNNGGTVAVYNLARILSSIQNEYEVKIYSENLESINPFFNSFATLSDIHDNSIVIYVEDTYGNPLNAKKFIRWMLFDVLKWPYGKDVMSTWGENDIIYNWENWPSTPGKKLLCCPWFNPIFKKTNLNSRSKTCFIIKKAFNIHKSINFVHPQDSIYIGNIKDLNDISRIFNECRYFFCYDPHCAFILFAASCGCTPIVYPIEGITGEEYFTTKIFNFRGKVYNKGICYGLNDSDIIKAEQEVLSNDLFSYYKELFDNYSITVREFYEDMKNL